MTSVNRKKCTLQDVHLKPVAKKKPLPKIGRETYEDTAVQGHDKKNPISLTKEHMHQLGRKLRKEEVYALNIPLGAESNRQALERKRREGSYSKFAEDAMFLRDKLIQYGLGDMLSDLEALLQDARAKEKAALTGTRRKIVLTRKAHEAAERMVQIGEDPRAFLRELSLIRERLYVHKERKFVNFVDYLRDVVRLADEEMER